jgi:hypothetical protein
MLTIYNQLRKNSFFFNAKMHSAKVQKCRSAKVQKYKLLQQGIMFIWSERINILDFDALHFRIIESSDDEVLIIIYILASKKLHPFVY